MTRMVTSRTQAEVTMAPSNPLQNPTENSVPTCPLCATLDHVERPLARHLALRADVLDTSWHCESCQATYHFPDPTSESPMRFGESRLA
jgi:hypothetical protein